MDITFEGQYKSITSFEWLDIPHFAVLTGTNGTGKSQLLDLIYKTLTEALSSNQRLIISGEAYQANEVTYLTSEWDLSNTSPVSIYAMQQEIRNLHGQFRRSESKNPRLTHVFSNIAKRVGKSRKAISEEEFVKNLPPFILQKENQMSQQIGKMFLDYRLSMIEQKAAGVTDEEFVQMHGQRPWLVLNDIIAESKLPFMFNNPEDEDVGFRDSFHFKILKIDTKQEIPFQDLSSGEKVLISLIFYLYNSQEKKIFPKILLLDEPDAHLHPYMTHQFIDVVRNVLVEKYEVRVIMTTHSPSTVALAPADSLFVMNRFNPRIAKIDSKNEAVALLTAGLVFVGPGTRYVLVEDEDDVVFYTETVQMLIEAATIRGHIPIVFIAASSSGKSGGRTVVRDWVTKLSQSGLDSIIFGLIDRDDGNLAQRGLFVLPRYSYENYLIDPLLIYASLIEAESAPVIEGVGLRLGEEYKLRKLNDQILQSIADTILGQVEGNIKNIFADYSSDETERIQVEFAGGHVLEYPKWLLVRRGKDLLNLYRNVCGTSINVKSLLKAYRKVQPRLRIGASL